MNYKLLSLFKKFQHEMVEKVTTPETKIATTISNNVRNSIFGHISPLVGRNNNKSSRCSSPKNNQTIINRSSRYV